MSFIWTNLVRRVSKARCNHRLVLLELADRADDRGYSFPSVTTIARGCNTSVRTVQRALQALQTTGELTILVEQGPHRCNMYRIRLDESVDRTVANNCRLFTLVDSPVSSAVHEGDASVIQTISDPSLKPTPVVPNGDKNDDFDFWRDTLFECLKMTPFPVDERSRRELKQQIVGLDKTAARPLASLYSEPFDSSEAREHPFNLRKRKLRTLIRHLPEMLSLALKHFPPRKPPPAPPNNWKERMSESYPDMLLPDDFWLLETHMQETIRQILGPDPPL